MCSMMLSGLVCVCSSFSVCGCMVLCMKKVLDFDLVECLVSVIVLVVVVVLLSSEVLVIFMLVRLVYSVWKLISVFMWFCEILVWYGV